MSKHFLSAKIYIYISLIACLMTLTINDQEGNFLLTGFEKKWKFKLNDEQNAKILADKLKTKKEIPLVFLLKDETINGERDAYCFNRTSNYFNFKTSENEAKFQPYDIIAVNDEGLDFLIIILENKHDSYKGIKIGQLINGANDPSELNDPVKNKIAQDEANRIDISKETIILSYLKEDKSDEVEKSDVSDEVEKSNVSDEVEKSDVSDDTRKTPWVIVSFGTGLLALVFILCCVLCH